MCSACPQLGSWSCDAEATLSRWQKGAGVENSGFLKLPWCVGCPADPVGALDYGLDLSAGFPSSTHPVHCGIAMDASPRSSSVDFPSQPKLVGPLA